MSSLNLIYAIEHIQHVLGLLVEFFVLPHFVFEHCRGFCPSSLGGRHRFLASKWHAKFMDTSWQSSIRKGGQIPRHAWNCSRIFGFRNLSVCVFSFVCFDNSDFCDGRRERPRCCWKSSCLPCWHWTFRVLGPNRCHSGSGGSGGASGSHQISSGQGRAEAKAAALAGPPHITEFCQKLAALEFP
jgi:hypothetical protein